MAGLLAEVVNSSLRALKVVQVFGLDFSQQHLPLEIRGKPIELSADAGYSFAVTSFLPFCFGDGLIRSIASFGNVRMSADQFKGIVEARTVSIPVLKVLTLRRSSRTVS